MGHTIGENIRIHRLVRGFSQEFLAKRIGKSQNWLHKLEKGSLKLDEGTLDQICEVLKVSKEHFFFSSPNEKCCCNFTNDQNRAICIGDMATIKKDINEIKVLLRDILKKTKL